MSDEKQEFVRLSDVAGRIEYSQALPEMRFRLGVSTQPPVLQQRWRIMTYDGKPPRHEWRDVPTVKEG